LKSATKRKALKTTKFFLYKMKKLILFFLVLLASSVFADIGEECLDLSLLNISKPSNDFTVYETYSFTFEAELWASDYLFGGQNGCTTTLTFEYDQGIAVFVQIPSPGPDKLYSLDATQQSVDLVNTALPSAGGSTYVPITVTCNTAGDYDLNLSATRAGGNGTSSAITIHCLPVPNLPPAGAFVEPSVPSSVFGDSFRLEWAAFDSDGDALTFDVKWDDGTNSGTYATGITDTFYDVNNLVPGKTYVFTVDISDGTNPVVSIESSPLYVKEKISSLTVSDLRVIPEAIYGDDSIDVNLTLRNDSSIAVDVNVLFFNDSFVPNPGKDSKTNVPAFSDVNLSFHQDFSGLEPGDYNVRVYARSYLPGTSTLVDEVTSYTSFTVLYPQGSVSLPETSGFYVFLVLLAALLIIKKG
jgi:hypothetical protein